MSVQFPTWLEQRSLDEQIDSRWRSERTRSSLLHESAAVTILYVLRRAPGPTPEVTRTVDTLLTHTSGNP